MNNAIDTSAFPSSFRYGKVLAKGKPVHDKNDSFSVRHPAMDLTKRAKIFSPFDALKGFDEELRIAQKKAEYAAFDETDLKYPSDRKMPCVQDMPLKKTCRN